MKKNNCGFTLVEVVIFLIVSGLMLSVLLPMYVMLRNVRLINLQNQATTLAENRMEIIEDWRNYQCKINETSAFANMCDPCSTDATQCAGGPIVDPKNATIPWPGWPYICEAPAGAGYTITSTIVSDGTYSKTVTVNVTGPGSASMQTTLSECF